MKWKQTGPGETFKVPPTERTLRVLDVDRYNLDLIVEGKFDGYVYTADPVVEDDIVLIEFTRYPAELLDEAAPVAPDYADSAE